MKDYRKNRFVQIGFWLFVIGAAPLFGIIFSLRWVYGRTPTRIQSVQGCCTSTCWPAMILPGYRNVPGVA